MNSNKNIITVKNLRKYFQIGGNIFNQNNKIVKAVDDVNIKIKEGRTFGLVGESGCGKSTLGRTILRLIEPTDGEIFFREENITEQPQKNLNKIRKNMQIIFQDPYSSLNPRMNVFETIIEPLKIHKIGNKKQNQERIEDLLHLVGLNKNILNRYPHEFSGGQCQRIGIARALALNPQFIVADEPVSSLDVSVQAKILNLFYMIGEKLGIVFLFISHDLAVIQHISEDVGVMYLGKMKKKTSRENLFKDPKHPYTRLLFSSIPSADPNFKRRKTVPKGYIPSPLKVPSGCSFHPRCPCVKGICIDKCPPVKNISTDSSEHLVACHLY